MVAGAALDRLTARRINPEGASCLRRGFPSHWVVQFKRNPLFKRPIGTGSGRNEKAWARVMLRMLFT
jgi:hypothetical protein